MDAIFTSLTGMLVVDAAGAVVFAVAVRVRVVDKAVILEVDELVVRFGGIVSEDVV